MFDLHGCFFAKLGVAALGGIFLLLPSASCARALRMTDVAHVGAAVVIICCLCCCSQTSGSVPRLFFFARTMSNQAAISGKMPNTDATHVKQTYGYIVSYRIELSLSLRKHDIWTGMNSAHHVPVTKLTVDPFWGQSFLSPSHQRTALAQNSATHRAAFITRSAHLSYH